MKKDLAIIGGLFVAVAALIIFGRGFTTGQFVGVRPQHESTRAAARRGDTADITTRDLKISAQIADTADKRNKGLSGQGDLPITGGMLFVFDKKGAYAIWMKDMKLPIDIIWIDESKKIVDIAQNALPEPGKKDQELKIYRARGDSKYILEINAGLARLHNLQIGDVVNFEL